MRSTVFLFLFWTMLAAMRRNRRLDGKKAGYRFFSEKLWYNTGQRDCAAVRSEEETSRHSIGIHGGDTMTSEQIKQEAEALRQTIVSDRQYLHAHAETGFALHDTLAFVRKQLSDMGY